MFCKQSFAFCKTCSSPVLIALESAHDLYLIFDMAGVVRAHPFRLIPKGGGNVSRAGAIPAQGGREIGRAHV